MYTVEVDENDNYTVTILDDTGQDEDIIIHVHANNDTLHISQTLEDVTETISLTPMQAASLKHILDMIVEEG